MDEFAIDSEGLVEASCFEVVDGDCSLLRVVLSFGFDGVPVTVLDVFEGHLVVEAGGAFPIVVLFG